MRVMRRTSRSRRSTCAAPARAHCIRGIRAWHSGIRARAAVRHSPRSLRIASSGSARMRRKARTNQNLALALRVVSCRLPHALVHSGRVLCAHLNVLRCDPPATAGRRAVRLGQRFVTARFELAENSVRLPGYAFHNLALSLLPEQMPVSEL